MITKIRAALRRRSDQKTREKYLLSIIERNRIFHELCWTSEDSSTYSLGNITEFSLEEKDDDSLLVNITDESTSNEALQCTICVDNRKNVVLNCGHCFCATCYNSLVQYQAPCPNCRLPIISGMRLYL